MNWVDFISRFKSNYFWFLGGAFVGAGFNFYANIFQFRNSLDIVLFIVLGTVLWILAGISFTIIAWQIDDVDRQTLDLSTATSETTREALFQKKQKILIINLLFALAFTILGFLVTWIPIIQN